MWLALEQQEENKSVSEQREELVSLNPDLLYWVYDIKEDYFKWIKYDWKENPEIKLEMLEDTLTCYPNQLNNLKWLEENPEILIIDLNELRKWKFKVLSWNSHPSINFFREDWSFKQTLDDWHTMNINRNLCLLSNWVIELINSKYTENWETKTRQHISTTLRDSWAADIEQRTTVAWRSYSNNLIEDLEAEYTEESPFLWKKNWKYYLFTPNRSPKKWIRWRIMHLLKSKDEIIVDLKKSVKRFLNTKYNLDPNNPEDAKKIKQFERTFKWIKYEELWQILQDIINNNRITFYDSKPLDNINWDDSNIKKIIINDFLWNKISSWKFFVFYDKENNTVEYRQLRNIKTPKWVKPNNRLYLESQNQWAKTHRLEDLWKENLVPTIKHFAKQFKNN